MSTFTVIFSMVGLRGLLCLAFTGYLLGLGSYDHLESGLHCCRQIQVSSISPKVIILLNVKPPILSLD